MEIFLNRKIAIFFLINILKITLGIEFDDNKKAMIALKASKMGYYLNNDKDDFYYDICLPFSYDNMDVSLEYRRKYFFFPDRKINKNVFSYPKRNNSLSCLEEYFEPEYLIINPSFYILIILIVFEATFLLLYIMNKNQSCFLNTPIKKIQDQDKYFCFFGNKERNKEKKNKSKVIKNFSEFVPEGTSQHSLENDNDNQNGSNKNYTQNTYSNLKLDTNTNTNTHSNLIIKEISSEFLMEKDKNIKEEKNEDKDIKNNQKLNYSLGNTNDLIDNSIQNSANTASFENGGNIDDKIDEKLSHIKNKESGVLSEKEKSIDNYTFGNDVRIGYNFSNIEKNETKSSKRKEKKNNNLINARYIFDTLNNNQKIKKFKGNNDKNEIDKEKYVQPCVTGNNQNINKIFYVREEYFYFGYLLARIEDKRNIFQIYADLLEQCQIIFKFLFCPFNIYEDRKLQLIYYLFKINLYLVFNCLLINSSVINNIFDDNNTLADDLFRSCISCIYTYIIGLFIYNLTNLKKELIKRRYKLLNLRMPNSRAVNEVLKITQSFYMNILFIKIIKLYFLSIVIFLISFFICFSFCGAYRYTQIYAFKGVLLSIYISQISPFALCWIPAILRRISMKKKNVKLYNITKFIEILFVA